MTPQEKKAEELIDKYMALGVWTDYQRGREAARECAFIAVNEILNNIDATIFYHKESKALPFNKEYWNEVKQHLNP